jgi:hypothetical protein
VNRRRDGTDERRSRAARPTSATMARQQTGLRRGGEAGEARGQKVPTTFDDFLRLVTTFDDFGGTLCDFRRLCATFCGVDLA